MSNYAVWNIRLRHEALTKPLKSKYLSRRKRARIGVEDALARKAGTVATDKADGSSEG